MKLQDIITIDERFQTSINLKLDIKNTKKLDEYIPSKTSVKMLQTYLEDIFGANKAKSTLLTGAYGKGKSHLLLVLINLLNQPRNKSDEHSKVWMKSIKSLMNRFQSADSDFADKLEEWINEERRYLPVIINFGRENLEQSYLLALNRALETEGFRDLIPNSHYDEAVKVINHWQEAFPETYESLGKKLEGTGNKSIQELKKALLDREQHSLKTFKKIYPSLTAGSIFNPLISMDVMDIYKDTAYILSKKYGYNGIIIIFDEFSKFIEGEKPQGVSGDMKLIQDMCELCNSTKAGEIRQIFVAHKSIKEYGKNLSKQVLNAFEGVEGRISEIPFETNAQNYYELIKNAIQKKNDDIDEITKLYGMDLIREAQKSYYLANFHTLFEKKEFEDIVVRGCFPMAPLTTFLLLQISENVGQNERTLFTFLSQDKENTLVRFIKSHHKNMNLLMGADVVYDYFRDLILRDKSNQRYQDECRKAEYILSQALTPEQKKIIKVMALLSMINSTDLPANDIYMQAASGMSTEEYEKVRDELLSLGHIAFRKRHKIYAFIKDRSINLENEIATLTDNSTERISIVNELHSIFEKRFELPKRYNQVKAITRYFEYLFLEQEKFFSLSSSNVFFSDAKANKSSFADGKIIILLKNSKLKKTDIKKKILEWKDERILVLMPRDRFTLEQQVREYHVIEDLLKNPQKLMENELVEEELLFYKDDLHYEINLQLEELYFPLEEIESTRKAETMLAFHYKSGDEKGLHMEQQRNSMIDFREFLSDICEDYYGRTPRINNELINRRNITAQTKNARKKIISALLTEENISDWSTGTAQEATIFRAVLENVGLMGGEKKPSDEMSTMLQIIKKFVEEASKEKMSFQSLYASLMGKDFGLRNGVIPIYLAWELSRTEGTPVLYVGNTEQELSAESLTSADAAPDAYSLFIQNNSSDVLQYLNCMEELFAVEKKLQHDKTKRLRQIVTKMQEWYRALPQYARITRVDESKLPDDLSEKSIQRFRDSLKLVDINPREYLFEKLMKIFDVSQNMDTFKKILETKKVVDAMYSSLIEDVAIITRHCVHIENNISLRPALTEWKQKNREHTLEKILSREANEFFNVIDNFEDDDSEKILNQVSRGILGSYLQDYGQDGVLRYQRMLQKVVDEIEASDESIDNDETKMSFSIQTPDGKKIEKSMKVVETDSTANYFLTELMGLVEEYDDEIDKEQKIQVLLKALESVVQ